LTTEGPEARKNAKNNLLDGNIGWTLATSTLYHPLLYCVQLSTADMKTRWAREPKSKTAHSKPFFENVVVWAAVLWTKSM